ncbi:MAG: serine protein kinase PrkA [Desulfobacteraceae bacterium]
MEMDESSPIDQALDLLNQEITDYRRYQPVSFKEFLDILKNNPSKILRNIFQVFHDMVTTHVDAVGAPIAEDPELLDFTTYDCTRLFVEGSENPYFPDMLFANRLMKQMETLRQGSQQNKIYIFYGPHGCGKSTFINNLLRKFEQYANTDEGIRYEIIWRLDVKKLWGHEKINTLSAFENFMHFIESSGTQTSEEKDNRENGTEALDRDYIEIPCMSHDNPFILIPKEQRRSILDELIENDEFKYKLFTEKEYEWVFTEEPCTVCSSIYQSLLARLGNPAEVFEMIYARPYFFNRRLGNGISVFNPGDKPVKQEFYSNEMLQKRINHLFQDSNTINYIYSRFAKVNNGIYALMDIKSYNTERMVELHNIISEGVHKVGETEEKVNSLFFALMNPEDKKHVKELPSFSDRIQYINIPYVLDVNTEVNIYRAIFGRHIDESFLPMVLDNFAKIIISSRVSEKSDALGEWIKDAEKYRNYCDSNLILLKMAIYAGEIPDWLDDDDRKALNAKMWRRIISESENEGSHGFSGRDSIRIFGDFLSRYSREDRLITTPDLCFFFKHISEEFRKAVPEGFLTALLRMYEYQVLQQVKESLYYYNELQIAKDIKNYITAVNFENNSYADCFFTAEKLYVTDEFMESIENRLLTGNVDQARRSEFRADVLTEYTTHTLSQELMVEGKDIEETRLFESLHERYVHNLKKRVLDPFVENQNFRRAIKDFDTEDFKTYDNRLRSDVKFLISNLENKFGYTRQGANEICIYVIDNNLSGKFQ